MSAITIIKRSPLVVLGLAAISLVGCASTPMPTEAISLSERAVAKALAVDATQYAPLEMRNAQEKLLLMQRAIGEKKPVAARLLAEQVDADANLAERKAQAVKAEQQLAKAKEGIQILRQEMTLGAEEGVTPSSIDNH